MSGHHMPAATRLGGITSRRHAELLLHSGVGDVSVNVNVKDLRLRRVVPPASGSLDSSPVCSALVKPGSVVSTPPEAASAAAAAEDLDRKPVLPRSKLVRDPGSFGYRRLLPFLNEMAKNGSSIDRSDSPLVDAPLGEIRCESDVMDSVEPVVAKAGGEPEVKDGCNVSEEVNTAPHDLASSKPWLAWCTRSRFVHHSTSFSYKRMLPFLMENEISSQEGERVKIRRIAEEKLSDENGDSASGQQHLAFSADSSQECNRAQVERMEEEEPPKADENRVLADGQPQHAVTKASTPECNAAEVQNVMQEKALTSSQDQLISSEGDLASDEKGVSASGRQHLAVSDDSSQECNRAQVERMEEEETPKADENCVLDDRQPQPAVTKASTPECNAAEVQNAMQEKALTSSQDPLTSSEGDLASDENGVSASGQQHLAVSDDSSQECNRGQVERMEEEETPKADENRVLDDRQPQPAFTKASPPECNAAEVQHVMQQEALTSSQDPLTSSECDLTSDRDVVQAIGYCQIVVSEGCPEECERDEVKRSAQDEPVKSDGSHILDSRAFQAAVSEIFPSKNSMAEVQKVAQEASLPSDGDEESSNKGDHLAQEQHQSCVTKESLTAQLQDNVEIVEVPQCQNKDSVCHDAGFVSPTKTVMPLLHQHCAQEPEDSVASVGDQLHDSGIQMICRPSDPCAVDRSLSVQEMSGCILLTESGCKTGISRPRGVHSMEKRGVSPKLSPRKGILKRPTRGCKGICMCLDCATFRLRADRAFEFSRKQMQEADDIISNLLKEVASLRSLVEKSAGQESTEAACKRASRVEEVAKKRCRQMFLDLNSHCRIPGPRVKFAQYVEEKKASPSHETKASPSPREKKYSPPPRSSSSRR